VVVINSKNFPKDNLDSKIAVFKQSPIFAHLREDELREIADLARPHHFNRGEFAFLEGDPCDFCHVVQEGRVKLFKQSFSGKIFTVKIASRGDTLHAVVLFEGKPRWASAQAMDKVTLLRVKKGEFMSFVTKRPSILMKIIGILGEQAHSAHERLIDMVGERAEQRLLNVLNMLCSKFGTTLSFTCEELADLAGTTTETTIRVISSLKKSVLVSSSRGKIVILDETKLRRSSNGPYLI
jgi:CRP/FNR family transcriptional regulator, nitrogen oxide reductase regulator